LATIFPEYASNNLVMTCYYGGWDVSHFPLEEHSPQSFEDYGSGMLECSIISINTPGGHPVCSPQVKFSFSPNPENVNLEPDPTPAGSQVCHITPDQSDGPWGASLVVPDLLSAWEGNSDEQLGPFCADYNYYYGDYDGDGIQDLSPPGFFCENCDGYLLDYGPGWCDAGEVCDCVGGVECSGICFMVDKDDDYYLDPMTGAEAFALVGTGALSSEEEQMITALSSSGELSLIDPSYCDPYYEPWDCDDNLYDETNECILCTDEDGDGYGVGEEREPCPHPEEDCDDTNESINPGMAEDEEGVCTDTKDNNCNDYVDCFDSGCYSIEGCTIEDSFADYAIWIDEDGNPIDPSDPAYKDPEIVWLNYKGNPGGYYFWQSEEDGSDMMYCLEDAHECYLEYQDHQWEVGIRYSAPSIYGYDLKKQW
jgi:hypothetical protein